MKNLKIGTLTIVLGILLCSLVGKLQAQTNLSGTYTDSGYFFHPTNPRAFNKLKTVTQVDTRTYQIAFGDWAVTDYSFQFQVDSNFNLVNWIPLYSTPASPNSGFMTLDNPGNISFGVTPLPGQSPYLHANYNNRYDTATKTFYLHYGYQLSGSGVTGQNGYNRQVYEKLQVAPAKESPTLTSFSPTSAKTNTVDTIRGTNLSYLTGITFGGVPPFSYKVLNDSTVLAVVGAGASGNVRITTLSGSDSLVGFSFIAVAPNITYFTPTSAGTGAYVDIHGTGLAGVTSVSLGGVPAISFYVINDTYIYAYVSTGASGNVSVTTLGGTAILSGFTYVASPKINSFSPTSATKGTTVTIKGSGFTNVYSVYFGNISASSFSIINDSTITAVVNTGSSGNIRVYNSSTFGTLSGFTYIAPIPVISYFTPTAAGTGGNVYIYGTGLTGATAVSFGGVPASSFYSSTSGTYISAYVGSGASGNVSVTTSGGTTTLAGFTYLPSPIVTSFNPISATKGTTVTIKGSNFTNATSVYFGGTSASGYTVINDSTITATISAGSSGSITVYTAAGSGFLAGFTYIAPKPVITSFSPKSGGVGTSVYITGTGLLGTTSVSFGGVPATSFYVYSDTYMYAYVGSGASGNVSVTTSGGTAILTGFTFIAPPVIKSFSPTAATKGTTVTINGSNFTNASNVYFGGTYAYNFSVINDSTLTAIVDAGTSGNISISTAGGTSYLSGFTYIAPKPVITSFSPTSAGTGTSVYIYGTGLSGATSVSFGGVSATSFYSYNDTYLYAYVGSGASGNINVTTSGGTATIAGFTFLAPPVVKSFSPTSATKGNTVIISGSGFSNTSSVYFGGKYSYFTVLNDSTISATIGTGSTGNVEVNTSAGTSSLGGFTYLAPMPVISYFSPTNAGKGGYVTIYGSGLTGTTAVSFGGVPASSISSFSDNYVYAYVGNGASGNVSVTTSGGTTSLGGFTFIPSATVTSFSPTTTSKGTTVTIIGSGFLYASNVSFGGTNATNFTIVDDSTITAIVGNGTSGSVNVVSKGGTGSLIGFTYKAPVPVITSFTPVAAGKGNTVYIYGTGLTGVTAVTFGGVPATSFYAYSDTYVYAYVGSGASGNISVTTSGGTATLAGFTYLFPPTLTSIYPKTATRGDTVTITGSGFNSTTYVYFGGTNAGSYDVLDDSTIKAVVGAGTSGNVTVYNSVGSGYIVGFTYKAPVPTITSFSPTSATNGGYIYVYGTGFTGATGVTFGGVPATNFSVYNDTYLYAYVGNGATGSVSVTTAGGTASLKGFVYATEPNVLSFYPTNASRGDTVTIYGTSFSGATRISFGGTNATSYSVVDDKTIIAVVGRGTSGNVTVYNPAGSSYLPGFVYTTPKPTITSFSPTSASNGSYVYINGYGFTGATGVSFGGVQASSFYVYNDTYMYAYVGNGASGTVSVNTPNGVASLAGFVFAVSPSITSFYPTTATNGDTVTIVGSGLSGATTVYFGKTYAASYKVVDDQTIKAIVASGSTGSVIVYNPAGSASLAGFTYKAPVPVITSFSPTSASSGSYVYIYGKGFTGTTSISFGGVKASSYYVSNDSTITAYVGNGASGNVSITTAGGAASSKGFRYIGAPIITSFTPTAGINGSKVTIYGRGFFGANSVSFGLVSATSYAVVNDSTITAIVGSGAAGTVRVTTIYGAATLAGFSYCNPSLVTLTQSACVSYLWNKKTYTQSGTYTFNTLSAGGCDSLTTLKLTINNPSTDTISITAISSYTWHGTTYTKSGAYAFDTLNDAGCDSLTILNLIIATPAISSFTPKVGITGTVVTILGHGFNGTTNVSFGGDSASSFKVLNDSTITATVGNGASGSVRVINKYGTDSLQGFVYKATPQYNLQGNWSISGYIFQSFGNYPSYSSHTDNVITKIAPNTFQLTSYYYPDPTTGWYFASYSFQFQIDTGNNLINWVALNSTMPAAPASGFMTLDNPGNQTFYYGKPGTGFYTHSNYNNRYDPVTNTLYLHFGFGTGSTSQNGFTVQVYQICTQPLPSSITSFTPSSTCSGTKATVFITGKNFTGVSSVTIGGKAVDSFKVNSPTSITAYVGANQTGAIAITNSIGTGTSATIFTNNNGFTAYAYIPSLNSGNVTIINNKTKTTSGTISLGSSSATGGMAVGSDQSKVYVSTGSGISVINSTTNTLLKQIAFVGGSSGVVTSPDGTKLYSSNGASFSVINTATDSVIATLPYPKSANSFPEALRDGGYGIVVTPDGKTVYAICIIDSMGNRYTHLEAINTSTNKIIADIPIGGYAYSSESLVINAEGSKVYVALGGMVIINTATNSIEKSIKSTGNCLCFSPDGTKIYTSFGKIINALTDNIIDSFPFTGGQGIGITPDGNTLYTVTAQKGGVITAVDIATKKAVATFQVGSWPVPVGNFIANVPTACSPLPVIISNISATNINEAVAVNWQTASEFNTRHFIVQHSTNGTSFTDIGTVKAIGSGANGYSFTDINPANGINYYRLKSVDIDGSSAYSKVVSAQLSIDNNQLSIVPNPAKDKVVIKGKHIVSVQVIDNLGRVVKTQTLKDATNPLLSVNSLPIGLYHVKVQTTDGKVNGISLIKQ